MPAIKTTHNAMAARLVAKGVGVTVLSVDAVTPARAPAPVAHKGVVILTTSTDRNAIRRNLDTDKVQITLAYQVPALTGAEPAMDAAMDLEQSILDALEDLDNDWDFDAAGLETVQHDRSTRGYHPRSTGWLIITIYMVVYRRTSSTP